MIELKRRMLLELTILLVASTGEVRILALYNDGSTFIRFSPREITNLPINDLPFLARLLNRFLFFCFLLTGADYILMLGFEGYPIVKEKVRLHPNDVMCLYALAVCIKEPEAQISQSKRVIENTLRQNPVYQSRVKNYCNRVIQ